MTYYLNFLLIAAIAAFTPGPNNSMLMQSGIYFGFRKTLRHIAGVIVGFNLLFFCINMGIYALIIRFPVLNIALKSIGTVYFSYLTYRMLTISPLPADKSEENTQSRPKKQIKPLGFIGAFFFQWINIKAWIFALSTVALLPESRTIYTVLIAQIIIVAIAVGSTVTWTLGGVFISTILKKPIHFKIINSILALSLIYIIIAQWF